MFRLFTVDGVERVVVYAGCEYDAWVTLSVLNDLNVDLWGLSRD